MLEIKFRGKEKEIWQSQRILKKSQKKATPKKTARKRKNKKPTKYIRFIDTYVGHYMYVYTPIEYNLLIEYCHTIKNQNNRHSGIKPEHIDLIALNSNDPMFRTVTFRRAFIKYKRFGTAQKKKAHWTLRDAVHFAKYSNAVHKQMKECVGI